MFKDKKTHYSNTISLTDEELSAIEAGTITGFNIATSYGIIPIAVSELSEPFRVPLRDNDNEFKGMSPYHIAKFDIPPGQYGSLKVYSREEIAKMYGGSGQ